MEKLPDPLKVVMFVNSGSEANDMAMYMARQYTGTGAQNTVLEQSCIFVKMYRKQRHYFIQKCLPWDVSLHHGIDGYK